MNTSFTVRRYPTISRVRTAIALAFALFAVTGTGCNQNQEGDRCNPDLSHDECNAGLSCQQPVDCPENYCCPTSGTSSNPNCQAGCNGGQASICAAGGDADCPGQGDDTDDAGATDAPSGS